MAGYARVHMDVPEHAPSVCLVAQRGTPGQKNWTLQRVATLIGARRPAHIVLHDQGTEDAHCVILNVGSEVLLKDLFTEAGTFHNSRRIQDVVTLRDGDTVRIAETTFDLEIAGAAAAQAAFDPEKYPWDSFAVCIDDTKQAWRVESKAALVGRHDAAEIRLDHSSVSGRHAVVFRFLDGVAVFDTGSGGVWLNGERVSLARLKKNDRVLVGPYSFRAYGLKLGEALPTWRFDAFDPVASAAPAGMPFPKVRRRRASSRPRKDNPEVVAANEDVALPPKERQEEPRDANPAGTIEPHSPEPKPEEAQTPEAQTPEAQSPETQTPETELSEAGTTQAKPAPPEVDERIADLERREAELQCGEELLLQRWQQMVSARCRRCGAPIRMAIPEGETPTSTSRDPAATSPDR